jgi:hypothetical protein
MADSKTELLKGLSLLELCLVVAVKRLIEKDCITFNFEMVYEEYKEFASKSANQLVEFYSKPVALKVSTHIAIQTSPRSCFPTDGIFFFLGFRKLDGFGNRRAG